MCIDLFKWEESEDLCALCEHSPKSNSVERGALQSRRQDDCSGDSLLSQHPVIMNRLMKRVGMGTGVGLSCVLSDVDPHSPRLSSYSYCWALNLLATEQ